MYFCLVCGGSMGTCFCSPQSYSSSSFSESWGTHPTTTHPSASSPYPTLQSSPTYQPVHHSSTYQSMHHSPTYQTAASLVNSSPSYGTVVLAGPGSPYQWGEVSSTQDLAAAAYIREFEEAYRGIPSTCHQQQQQQIAMDDSLCQQQIDCFQQYPLDTEFFQPNQIFQLDQPLSDSLPDNNNRYGGVDGRFNNPAFDNSTLANSIRFDGPDAGRTILPDIHYGGGESEFRRGAAACKFSALSSSGQEKMEFVNPGGDYPDLYTAAPTPPCNQRTNSSSLHFQPSPSNYGGSTAAHLEFGGGEGESWRFHHATATAVPAAVTNATVKAIKKDMTEMDFDQFL